MTLAPDRIPIVLLGGTGYVAGELLRLLAAHPRFAVETLVSTSRPGERVDVVFPHLAGTTVGGLAFQPLEATDHSFTRGRAAGIFAATPHGATAALLDAVLRRAEAAGAPARAVDLSADFRFADPGEFTAIYGTPHGAPERAARFVCALPEHHTGEPPEHAAQPGCFTTATVLAAYPLLARGLCEGDIFVSAVTGSSGSGRTPAAHTHHPERRSNLHAYAPLAHRHEAEMRRLLAAACGGAQPEVAFVPHSGPFVRGIHATLRLTLRQPLTAADAASVINEFYAGGAFVSAGVEPARLADVIGTNRCRLGVAARGRTLVVTSVIDNLVKGAAGGAVQWMNRLMGLADDTGLRQPGLGWC